MHPRIYKPGKKSLASASVVIFTMMALAIAIVSLPGPADGKKEVGVLCGLMGLLIAGLMTWMRSTSRLILEDEGVVCKRIAGEIRLRWDQISGVRGTMVSGSKSDREMVVLEVPNMKELIAQQPKLKSFRFGIDDEIGIYVSLYDESAGEIVEEIKRRLKPTKAQKARKSQVSSKPRGPLQTYPAKTYRAWLAWGMVAVFCGFSGMGVFIGETAKGRISAYILSAIFLLFFVTLGGVALALALIQRITLGTEYLEMATPGLTLRVHWQDVCGVEKVGLSRSEMIVVKLRDFDAFRDSLPEKSRNGLISLLGGRAEGLPLTRTMMPVGTKHLMREIEKRAGLISG